MNKLSLSWLKYLIYISLLFATLWQPSLSNVKQFSLANETICGTMDIRSLMTFNSLKNCTVIEGNLVLAMVDIPTPTNVEKAHFPKLREITGYLLIYYAMKITTLGHLFPNLIVIRGNQLIAHYSVVIKETDLTSVGLFSLREISNGGVRFEDNPRLCYINSIDWSKIVRQSDKPLRVLRSRSVCPDICDNKAEANSLCSASDKVPGRRLCWSAGVCQPVCSQLCLDSHLACHIDKPQVCCHDECLGGCYGVGNASECVACRHVLLNGICQKSCPLGYYKFVNRRCITADQCRQIVGLNDNLQESESPIDQPILMNYSIFGGECVRECPANYLRNNITGVCEICDLNNCPKRECSTIMIFNMKDLRHIRGCHSVEDLLINIREPIANDEMNDFEQAFSTLRIIKKSLRIFHSKNLHSLRFLRHLEEIRGIGLTPMPFRNNNSTDDDELSLSYRTDSLALEIASNEHLRELWVPIKYSPDKTAVPSRLTIKQGGIYVALNRFLCPNKIFQFINNSLTLNHPLSAFEQKGIEKSNGDLIPCHYDVLNISVLRIDQFAINVNITEKGFFNEFPLDNSVFTVYYRVAVNNVTMFDDRDSCGKNEWSSYNYGFPVNKVLSILNLKPATRYAFYVEAKTILHNKIAISPIIHCYTKPSNPSVPRSLKIEPLTSSEILITWKPPLNPNGNVTRYFIWYRACTVDPETFKDQDRCQEMNIHQTKDDQLSETWNPKAAANLRESIYLDTVASPGQTLLNTACQQCASQCRLIYSSNANNHHKDSQEHKLADNVNQYTDPKKVVVHISMPDRLFASTNSNYESAMRTAANNVTASVTLANKTAFASVFFDKEYHNNESPQCPLIKYADMATQDNEESDKEALLNYGILQVQRGLRDRLNQHTIDSSSGASESNGLGPNNGKSSSLLQHYGEMQRVEISAERTWHVLTGLTHYTEYSIELQACHDVDQAMLRDIELSKDDGNVTHSDGQSYEELADINLIENIYCSERVSLSGKTLPNYSFDRINESRIIVKGTPEGWQLQWPAPDEPNGIVLNYHIRYRQISEDPVRWSAVCVSTDWWKQFSTEEMKPIDIVTTTNNNNNNSLSRSDASYILGGFTIKILPGTYEYQIGVRSLASNVTWTRLQTFRVLSSFSIIDYLWISVAAGTTLVLFVILPVVLVISYRRQKKLQASTVVSSNPDYMDIFDIGEWEIDREDVDTMSWSHPLGKGSFGMVYRGRLRALRTPAVNKILGPNHYVNMPVAIKTLSERRNMHSRRDFINEACYMRQFQSAHIVQLFGVVMKPQIAPSYQLTLTQRLHQFYLSNRPSFLLHRLYSFGSFCQSLHIVKRPSHQTTTWYRRWVIQRKPPKKSPNQQHQDENSRDEQESAALPVFVPRQLLENSPLVVMELMPLGDLATYFRHLGNVEETGCISAEQALLWAAQICDGCAYLESKKFVHRDLAARNCMIDAHKVVKIGDFGLARDIYERLYYRKKGAGEFPIRWMAPETLSSLYFTSKSDVWSYGVVLWEIATLASLPYHGMSYDEVFHFVQSGFTLCSNGFPANCPPLFCFLMQNCWAYNRHNRPSFIEILQLLLPNVDERFRKNSFYYKEWLPEQESLSIANQISGQTKLISPQQVLLDESEPELRRPAVVNRPIEINWSTLPNNNSRVSSHYVLLNPNDPSGVQSPYEFMRRHQAPPISSYDAEDDENAKMTEKCHENSALAPLLLRNNLEHNNIPTNGEVSAD